MSQFDPPGELITAILNGRCVAFVGAGFAADVMPSWNDLLRVLGERLDLEVALPPVIVFAAPQDSDELLKSNRRECLHRGAWEYTTEWSELYRAIELVLGRVPGQTDSY